GSYSEGWRGMMNRSGGLECRAEFAHPHSTGRCSIRSQCRCPSTSTRTNYPGGKSSKVLVGKVVKENRHFPTGVSSVHFFHGFYPRRQARLRPRQPDG